MPTTAPTGSAKVVSWKEHRPTNKIQWFSFAGVVKVALVLIKALILHKDSSSRQRARLASKKQRSTLPSNLATINDTSYRNERRHQFDDSSVAIVPDGHSTTKIKHENEAIAAAVSHLAARNTDLIAKTLGYRCISLVVRERFDCGELWLDLPHHSKRAARSF